MKKLTLFSALLVLSSLAAAQVYTWKDASGKTVYSDTPPPIKTVKEVNIKVAPAKAPTKKEPVAASDAVPGKEQSVAEQQAALAKKIADENKRIEAENKKRNADNCNVAKLNLASAEAANNQALVQRYRNAVQSYCK